MRQDNDLEAQAAKLKNMTEAPVKQLILKLAGPTMVSMMITSIYNLADTFFMGRIGTSATAAVGIAFPLMSIIQAIGFMFGHGSGNYISRALGAQKTEEAEIMASMGFFSALIGGILFSWTGLLFLHPLVRLLGATETMMSYATQYVRIILIGAPWMCASLVLNNQLRFQGNAFFSMIGITSGGILNIILDPLLIFVLNMGIQGAALATIISQLASFCLLFAGTRKSDNLNIHFRNFRPRLRYYVEMFKGGAPSLCRQGIASIATTVMNHSAGIYGDAAVAAISIVTRIMQFFNSMMIGFAQGFQPVCGFNYGAKKYKRVREGFFFCVRVCTVFLTIVAVAAFIFAPMIIRQFRKEDLDVLQIGVLSLRLQCLTLPLSALVMVSNMMMQVLAKVGRASVLALARQGLFLLPLLLILPGFFGLLGIQIAQPISDLISFSLALILETGLLRQLKQNEQ